jgi:hypothetical protein
MQFPLVDLLRVRELRENRRKDVLRGAQAQLEQARQLAHSEKRRLEEFTVYRQAEEAGLYGKLSASVVRTRHLRDLRHEIFSLRSTQLAKEQKVGKVEEEVRQAGLELEGAQEAYQMASRALEKLLRQQEIWVEEWTRQDASTQEKELEELLIRRIQGEEENEDVDEAS